MNEDYYFNIKKKRPEEIYDKVSDYFYGERLDSYATSKNIQRIQLKITKRALEIIQLQKEHALILDAGCGPGFASFYIKNIGYQVVAFDIIKDFLFYYDIKDINPIVGDMCFPPFKPESFDAIVSISALQWIYRDIENKIMTHAFSELISSFYKILKFGSKAIFQFYPKNNTILEHMRIIINEKSDFDGGFIIDNPDNPRKRRIFLILEKK
ncbi:MAG: class I SAM-dependent methyltransferase [Candidatus Lokiarchaeota archaeon]|nr:class I SAM-dependent methyltransferase [Candidatus Lokiarchaeota archaeon]